MEIPKFSDLSSRTNLEGDKVRIDDILDREIIVTGAQISDSKYKNKGCRFCTKLQFYFLDDTDETKHVLFSGSDVIKSQIDDVTEALEQKGLDFRFVTKITKQGNFYSFA